MQGKSTQHTFSTNTLKRLNVIFCLQLLFIFIGGTQTTTVRQPYELNKYFIRPYELTSKLQIQSPAMHYIHALVNLFV